MNMHRIGRSVRASATCVDRRTSSSDFTIDCGVIPWVSLCAFCRLRRRSISAMARSIEARLRTDYRYDLDSPSGADPHPLLHFLFKSKSGHCEFYSTAMAMLSPGPL